jgi:hypothetical protein
MIAVVWPPVFRASQYQFGRVQFRNHWHPGREAVPRTKPIGKGGWIEEESTADDADELKRPVKLPEIPSSSSAVKTSSLLFNLIEGIPRTKPTTVLPNEANGCLGRMG